MWPRDCLITQTTTTIPRDCLFKTCQQHQGEENENRSRGLWSCRWFQNKLRESRLSRHNTVGANYHSPHLLLYHGHCHWSSLVVSNLAKTRPICPYNRQIWDFSHFISAHLAHSAKMYRNWSLKVTDLSYLRPIWPNLDAKFSIHGGGLV